MRERKLKIWNKTFKMMSRPVSLFDFGRQQADEYYREEELEFLEYTGLKDKNGVEIYEGAVASQPSHP